MKIETMRFLDKYAGKLFLACLAVCTALSKPHASSRHREISKILIVKFWGFGSIILAYDLFSVIRTEYPDAKICALTLKQNRQVFEMTGLFDEVVALDVKNIFRCAADTVAMIAYLRKKAFDVSIDLEFSSRFSAAASRLIAAKKRIGFHYAGVWRGHCFSDILQFHEDRKLRDSYLQTAWLIDGHGGRGAVAARPRRIRLNIGDTQKAVADRLLKTDLAVNGPLVGCNINASGLCLLRRWPKEYFVDLAEALIGRYGAHIAFIGAAEDSLYVGSGIGLIRSQLRPHAHDLTGRISLEQLAYLMTAFKLFISNDSGPLHLAAYLKIPTISFFGPETPLIYGPDGDSDTVFYSNPGCSPCIRVKNYKDARCINNHCCLRAIKPADVVDEIRRKRLL